MMMGREVFVLLLSLPKATPAPVEEEPAAFTDDFNRANENLEASANWTRVGGSAGDATVASNACAVPTTNASSAFQCPDIESADHYAEADWMTVAHNAGPFIACRLTDVNNFVGARWDNGNTRVQLYKRVTGTFTNIANVAQAMEIGDRLRLECSGDNARVLLNDVEVIAPTSLAGSLASATRCGLVPRLIVVSPWIDNFEAGAL